MTPMGEKKEDNLSKGGKIHISKEAFRNMITHVLRFGNENLHEEERGVMGICFGKLDLETQDLNLITALPIFHGMKVEVGLSKEEYNLLGFKDVIEKYSTQDLHLIGWYHSHPGWGIYMSESDLRNHHFYQNERNPYGFAIVFDHTMMGQNGNLGLEIYRLQNFSDLLSKDYYKVDYELEPPNTLEFFKWVQKFAEDSHKKHPILIKELNELKESVPDNLQEIPKSIPSEAETTSKDDELFYIKDVVSGMQNESIRFIEDFKNLLEKQLGNWTNDIQKGVTGPSESIGEVLGQMKDKVSMGMNKIEKFFTQNLDEILHKFKQKIYGYINERIDQQKDIANQFSNLSEDINTNYKHILQKNISSIMNALDNSTLTLAEKIKVSNQNNNKMEEIINQSTNFLLRIKDQADNFSNNLLNGIRTNISPLSITFGSEIEKINKEISTIKDSFEKVDTLLKKVQTSLSSLKEL